MIAMRAGSTPSRFVARADQAHRALAVLQRREPRPALLGQPVYELERHHAERREPCAHRRALVTELDVVVAAARDHERRAAVAVRRPVDVQPRPRDARDAAAPADPLAVTRARRGRVRRGARPQRNRFVGNGARRVVRGRRAARGGLRVRGRRDRVERAGERGAEQAASGDVHVEGSGLKSEDVAAFAMPVVGEWARVCAGRRVARRDACDPPRRRRAARPRVAGGVSRWARARWPRRRARRADVGCADRHGRARRVSRGEPIASPASPVDATVRPPRFSRRPARAGMPSAGRGRLCYRMSGRPHGWRGSWCGFTRCAFAGSR